MELTAALRPKTTASIQQEPCDVKQEHLQSWQQLVGRLAGGLWWRPALIDPCITNSFGGGGTVLFGQCRARTEAGGLCNRVGLLLQRRRRRRRRRRCDCVLGADPAGDLHMDFKIRT